MNVKVKQAILFLLGLSSFPLSIGIEVMVLESNLVSYHSWLYSCVAYFPIVFPMALVISLWRISKVFVLGVFISFTLVYTMKHFEWFFFVPS